MNAVGYRTEPLFFTAEAGTLVCDLCPHACTIPDGGFGRCGVRGNLQGEPFLPYAGKATALAVDPVEKKPLYHVHPGTTLYSIGFLGCPLHCPFCQNFRISQSTRAATRDITPQEAVAAAQEASCAGIAYTYNEPIIHIEFILETAQRAQEAGLVNVLVTSGQINPKPARRLFCSMDAANIDLKSFQPEFYRKALGGHLDAVKEAIRIAVECCRLEVTTLVIPGKNDSDEEIDAMARFLAELDPTIAYHLSAYFPSYRYEEAPTPPATLLRLAEVARAHLPFVYLGNVAHDNNTYCHQCGELWITRHGYHTAVTGIEHGKCTKCAAEAPITGV